MPTTLSMLRSQHSPTICSRPTPAATSRLEKPAALDVGDLRRLLEKRDETGGFLSVGYNRRFSSHAKAIQDFFGDREGPIVMHYRVVNPAPPPDSWLLMHTDGVSRPTSIPHGSAETVADKLMDRCASGSDDAGILLARWRDDT